MCNFKISNRKGFMSPLPVKLAKITVVLIFFCFAECAAGSCLSYGHACWGAHGKRSGSRSDMPLREASSNSEMANTRWFLSKLISPFDLRLMHSRDFDIAANQRGAPERQLYTGTNAADALKGPDDWESAPDLEDEQFFDEISPILNHKLKASKRLDKRSSKFN